jgi:para-nitrobenzyl esterase
MQILNLFASAALAAPAPAPAPAFVDSPAGKLEGRAIDGIAAYLGIPYARPPVGALRWRAPQSLPRWHQRRATLEFGPVCMQPTGTGDSGVGVEPASEDCLTLNIWSPKRQSKRLPVMVWVHGGGYTSGSGSAALYDARMLAARGVVVVTINYRLGRFGFFAHPGLVDTGEGANFGLLDQRAALAWIRNNIAAFGGDPRRVTLFGNSAGGESVLFHMASPKSSRLFARAIVQSGLGGRTLRTSANSVDADRADTSLSKLRALPASEILAWGMPSLYKGFGPTIDGISVSESIETTFRAGRQARFPLIIGFNGLEIPPAFVGGPSRAVAMVDHDASTRAAGIAAYGDVDAYEQNIASDALFRAPALRLAQIHARSGAATWTYMFDVVSLAATARLTGAPHASERAYVFGNLSRLGWTTDARDDAVSHEIGDRWVAFAKGGDQAAGRMDWVRATPVKANPIVFNYGERLRDPELSPALSSYFRIP